MNHLEYIELLKKKLYDNFMASTSREKALERYHHSLGVMNMAGQMAFMYHNDEEFIKKCEIAGILHDYAKFFKREDYEKLTKEYHVEFCFDKDYERVYHGYYGYLALIRDFDIHDEDILNAVKNHIMGRSNMTLIEKIIYVADLIEEGRTEVEIPILKPLRDLVLKGKLDEGVAFEAKHVVSHLINKNIPIHPVSLETYNYYIKYLIKEGL
ncbi:MAG: bis(5'-nucleosyl)-tetraphosphatase (symmetrical) YqeK [Bacilli bacterium]|nr:bis(5'-nucleosyl)-tetraphosphatase (symmetrical) YqeK [Bacilli bacterium]